MDLSINQANQAAVNQAEEIDIRAVGGGQQHQSSGGALGNVPVAVVSTNHAPERAGQEEQETSCLASFCDHVTSVATVPHMLWNSIPPFIVEGDRQRYATRRGLWVQRRNDPLFAEELGLRNEIEAVISAHDALIALPSYGYHLVAQQRYNALNEAEGNYRSAETAAFAAQHAARLAAAEAQTAEAHGAADEGATVLTPIPGSKGRAYNAIAPLGTGQAHDAVLGRAGRMPEPTNAIPIAEEIPDEATIDPNLSHAEAEDATPMDPEHTNPELVPVTATEAHVENSAYIPPEHLG